MHTDGNMHMSFDFGEGTPIIEGAIKMGFSVILVGSSISFTIIWYYIVLWTQF